MYWALFSIAARNFHYLCQQFFTYLAQFSLSLSPDSADGRPRSPSKPKIRTCPGFMFNNKKPIVHFFEEHKLPST
ncbi:hypothetical protein BUPH_08298 (plasmid) [Paraburkholderia phenoliruptrix BR3459a]|uniref:Uncharacterized protein n=1 Tax=Paraburkholderia phenoliruptrix BR3459a TaxID=1229205 RepID=K0E137_9BURK|nr:hypothetical protein BUPH_08298 [Paraburkholderia phenoliruptrix BR3459a]